MKKKIVIVAGDKSADLYAGLLCKQLKTKYPQTEIFSFAGSSTAQNSRQVIDLLSHSVSGIFEVLLSLRKILS
ncbi:MAG: lipid-A-disaccharide synthase, partial [Candidatus Omnitrophota bacterium]